ncbi:MAG: hypothetical protein DHS80DRAFT_20542 [Piptocephalis tieghemiana]|nr:MAG: hypothetical protein DHS80DRAFT_20542 [Piptocephalis tieghemiana]
MADSSNQKATPLLTSATSTFGGKIEGVGVDAKGDVYAVDWNKSLQSVGSVFSQKAYYVDPIPKAHMNGVRFFGKGAFIADATGHRVLKTTSGSDPKATVACANPGILQPNDLALAPSGHLYLTGMAWAESKGDLWMCTPSSDGPGSTTLLSKDLDPTNGIEVDACRNLLYVSQITIVNGSKATGARILRLPLDSRSGKPKQPLTSLTRNPAPQPWVNFDNLDQSGGAEVDGMRLDVRGNLYVTRLGEPSQGGGQVLMLSPEGKILERITVSFNNPTNLELGGPNGTTLVIVGACRDDSETGCVDTWEAPYPGQAWSRLQGSHRC